MDLYGAPQQKFQNRKFSFSQQDHGREDHHEFATVSTTPWYRIIRICCQQALALVLMSAANVGADKGSEKRQRQAIESFAKANGLSARW